MSQTSIPIDIENIVTEDDTPVDNILSEKQQRLLTEPLYSCWSGPGQGRTFLAAANVGLFYSVHMPPIVPDVFLSLDVQVPDNFTEKKNRSYFFWEFGKPPEVAIEIVSNQEGGEDSSKLARYASIGIAYYVIFDPLEQLQGEILTIYELHAGAYQRRADGELPTIGLGLRLWAGVFEQKPDTWLRWSDAQGIIIPTGQERAEQERQRACEADKRAEQERQRAREADERASEADERAEQERQRAREANKRAEELAKKLKEMGIDPDSI
jgi:Uma2 family endonuclease